MDGIADVEEARAMINILARQQKLGDRQLMGLERVGPNVHQPPLAHRRDRLELGQVGGSLRKIQLAQPRPDRA